MKELTLQEKANKLIKEEYPKDIRMKPEMVLEVPFVVEKYLSIQFKLMESLNIIEHKYETTLGNRFKYYKEEKDFQLNASEIKNYLLCDVELSKLSKTKKTIEMLLKQITEIISELRNLHWIFKTSLEYNKYINHS